MTPKVETSPFAASINHPLRKSGGIHSHGRPLWMSWWSVACPAARRIRWAGGSGGSATPTPTPQCLQQRRQRWEELGEEGNESESEVEEVESLGENETIWGRFVPFCVDFDELLGWFLVVLWDMVNFGVIFGAGLGKWWDMIWSGVFKNRYQIAKKFIKRESHVLPLHFLRNPCKQSQCWWIFLRHWLDLLGVHRILWWVGGCRRFQVFVAFVELIALTTTKLGMFPVILKLTCCKVQYAKPTGRFLLLNILCRWCFLSFRFGLDLKRNCTFKGFVLRSGWSQVCLLGVGRYTIHIPGQTTRWWRTSPSVCW